MATTQQQTQQFNGTSPPLPAQTVWKLHTLADAYTPRTPVEYLIENILELPSLNMVYGAPSSLKSFVLADMAICIATGKTWLNPGPSSVLQKKANPKQTIQKPVLWVDFDNGLRRTHERFDMLGKAHHAPDSSQIYYASMAAPPLMMNNDNSVLHLTTIIKLTQAKLVVIDNLGTVCGAKVDENSADMVAIMYNFRKIVEETGAALIIVHHQRKANGFKTRIGETLRGHSSIEASLDLALLVEREAGSREIKIYSTKSRGIDVKPFGAMFEHYKDGNGIENAIFYGVFVEDTNSDDAIKQAILDIVLANMPGINQKDLTEEVKNILNNPGINRIRKLIVSLVSDGKLDKIPSGKNSSFYIIP